MNRATRWIAILSLLLCFTSCASLTGESPGRGHMDDHGNVEVQQARTTPQISDVVGAEGGSGVPSVFNTIGHGVDQIRNLVGRVLGTLSGAEAARSIAQQQRDRQITQLVAAAEAKAASSRPPRTPRGAQGRPPVSTCESGHWIEAVEGDGKMVKLENGSLWEVDDVDTVTTSIWLPASEVIVCHGKMVNVDDGESAEVTPLTPGVGGGRKGSAGGALSYVIEASANDETFVINGEVFKAMTYCFGFERGDRVRFLSGSSLGACASARILNLHSGKVCKVSCE